MGEWHAVAKLEQVPPMGLRVVVDDEEMLVVRAGEGVKIFSYLCSHQEMPLEGGNPLDDAWVCPHHGARFSLTTGDALSMPAVSGIKIFQSRVDNGDVYVML